MEDIMMWTIIGFFVFAMLIVGLTFVINNKRLEQLERYWDVELGMSEDDMLDIMGDDYYRSLLKNNRVKYEGRIEATSHGSSYKGISSRVYSGVKKVTIYVKDGVVEEVKPYNV